MRPQKGRKGNYWQSRQPLENSRGPPLLLQSDEKARVGLYTGSQSRAVLAIRGTHRSFRGSERAEGSVVGRQGGSPCSFSAGNLTPGTTTVKLWRDREGWGHTTWFRRWPCHSLPAIRLEKFTAWGRHADVPLSFPFKDGFSPPWLSSQGHATVEAALPVPKYSGGAGPRHFFKRGPSVIGSPLYSLSIPPVLMAPLGQSCFCRFSHRRYSTMNFFYP